MTAKSNNTPLLATFNSYKRKQTKRSQEEIQRLRDALKPKVIVLNDDGEEVEQIEEVMLIDQPSPRTILTKAKSWKAPFTDLHGTFYDSDLEEDEKKQQQEEKPSQAMARGRAMSESEREVRSGEERSDVAACQLRHDF